MDGPSRESEEANEHTSLTLLEKVRCDDPEGWTRLSDVYGPLVYRWAREAGLQGDDAADVVQEVFRSLLKAVHGFRREKPGDSFRGWLYVITRNKIRDHFRRISSRPDARGGTAFNLRLNELPDACADETSEVGQLETNGVYMRALESIRENFGEKTWQAFWRMTVKNDPAAEIAEDIGLAVWSVYKAKARVMKRLRTEFEGMLD